MSRCPHLGINRAPSGPLRTGLDTTLVLPGRGFLPLNWGSFSVGAFWTGLHWRGNQGTVAADDVQTDWLWTVTSCHARGWGRPELLPGLTSAIQTARERFQAEHGYATAAP